MPRQGLEVYYLKHEGFEVGGGVGDEGGCRLDICIEIYLYIDIYDEGGCHLDICRYTCYMHTHTHTHARTHAHTPTPTHTLHKDREREMHK